MHADSSGWTLRCAALFAAGLWTGCWYEVADMAPKSQGATSTTGGGGGGEASADCSGPAPAALKDPRGVTLDGASFLSRPTLNGEVNSPSYTLSFWYRVPSINETMEFLMDDNQRIKSRFLPNGTLERENGASNGGTDHFVSTNPVAGLDPNWHHLAISQEIGGAGRLFLYVDGAAVNVNHDSVAMSPLDFTGNGGWAVGAEVDGINRMVGDISEFYFAIGSFLDLSSPACLARLRTSDGHPADLGANGGSVTGKQPHIYLHTTSAGPESFADNKGSGGSFVIQGKLAYSNASP